MELRQLEYLVAVLEEGNFTRAAERVHISQSGISAQIRKLEHEVGAELIDRSGRTATPTNAGMAALPHARAALQSVSALEQAVDDVTGVIRGRLAVGMVTACAVTPLFDALAAFGRARPGVKMALREDNSDRLVEDVRVGALDLALIGAAGRLPAGLKALTLISEGLVAAVPPGHALAGRKRIRLADAVRHPLICLPAGTGVRAVLDAESQLKALSPHITLQASAPSAVVDLAVRGLGVAILSETMAAGYADRLHAIALSDVRTPAILALVWRPVENPALRELLDHCRAAFTQVS